MVEFTSFLKNVIATPWIAKKDAHTTHPKKSSKTNISEKLTYKIIYENLWSPKQYFSIYHTVLAQDAQHVSQWILQR